MEKPNYWAEVSTLQWTSFKWYNKWSYLVEFCMQIFHFPVHRKIHFHPNNINININDWDKFYLKWEFLFLNLKCVILPCKVYMLHFIVRKISIFSWQCFQREITEHLTCKLKLKLKVFSFMCIIWFKYY